MDPKKIKPNEDNDAKFLTGELGEDLKKKKKNAEEPTQESSDSELPIEYFTE